MNLIDFGMFFTVQKEKIDIEKAKAEKEIIENEYKLQLLESFYQALFTQELLTIQKLQLDNSLFNLSLKLLLMDLFGESSLTETIAFFEF